MAAELSTWLTVALVAIVAVITFKLLAASRVGAAVPGLTKLAAFI
jgi:predicted exporter